MVRNSGSSSIGDGRSPDADVAVDSHECGAANGQRLSCRQVTSFHRARYAPTPFILQ